MWCLVGYGCSSRKEYGMSRAIVWLVSSVIIFLLEWGGSWLHVFFNRWIRSIEDFHWTMIFSEDFLGMLYVHSFGWWLGIAIASAILLGGIFAAVLDR
jgi:hypothetical protein